MRWHIGLMTGTVLDGNIDVAFLRTDGKTIEEFGYYNLMPYDEEVKDLLIKTLNEAQIWNFNGPEPEIFSKTEAALTNSQTVAVQKCIKLSGIDKNVPLILALSNSSHGKSMSPFILLIEESMISIFFDLSRTLITVSYTHLTLPTKRIV